MLWTPLENISQQAIIIQSLSKKDYEEWEEAIDLEDLESLSEEQEKKLEMIKYII